jgi:hypothetical protein
VPDFDAVRPAEFENAPPRDVDVPLFSVCIDPVDGGVAVLGLEADGGREAFFNEELALGAAGAVGATS